MFVKYVKIFWILLIFLLHLLSYKINWIPLYFYLHYSIGIRLKQIYIVFKYFYQLLLSLLNILIFSLLFPIPLKRIFLRISLSKINLLATTIKRTIYIHVVLTLVKLNYFLVIWLSCLSKNLKLIIRPILRNIRALRSILLTN